MAAPEMSWAARHSNAGNEKLSTFRNPSDSECRPFNMSSWAEQFQFQQSVILSQYDLKYK